jgi:prevent-host-death family protein
MKRKVGIAELKAHLSEYVRSVRDGGEWVVMDRQTPVARLGPYRADDSPARPGLRIRPPRGKYKSIADVPLPPPLDLDFDPAELLIELRQNER